MKVFISWSGQRSKAIAEHLRDWLPNVLQSIDPYFTPSDVEKGARWLSDISDELSNSKIGILCITRESVNSPWLLFEAGALSKELEDAYVCPIVFDIKPTDLAGPMAQFQATEFAEDDFRRLVGVLNSRLGERQLPGKNLDAVFAKFWPDLKRNIGSVLDSISDDGDTPVRPVDEMLDEILQLVRRPRSTVVSEKALTDLLTGHIALHDEQSKGKGGYQSALSSLQKMHAPLQHIIRRHAPQMAKTELVLRFSSLPYQVEEKVESTGDPPTGDFEDDIPF